MLIKCQQALTKAYNEACQNVKGKKEADVHKMLTQIPDAEKTRPYLVDGVRSQNKAHSSCPFCGHGYMDEPATNKDVLNKG